MIPAAYTELSLAEYMVTVTRNVTAALGWTGDDFLEAVNDTLVAYGASTITGATDITKLRTLAKVAAWQTVVDGTAADFDFAADGGDYKRSQMHKQAVAALERVKVDAASYVPQDAAYAYSITMGAIVFDDAYGSVQ